MEKERIPYIFSERETVLQQISEANKRYEEDHTVDLDEDHIPTNCFFVVVDAPPGQPAQASPDEILAQADMDILNLTEQLILLQEGL